MEVIDISKYKVDLIRDFYFKEVILDLNKKVEELKQTVFELPAGKLEKSEEPFPAAQRELEEETGYRANNWKELGYINTTPGFCDEKLYLYHATDLEFVGEHPDDGEIIEAYEFKIDEVFDKIKNGEINDSKTICALTRAFKI